MKQATNIEEQQQNAREFAQLIDEAYRSFHETSLLKENGLKCLPVILSKEEINTSIEKGININQSDLIPIRNGIQFVGVMDALANFISLQD